MPEDRCSNNGFDSVARLNFDYANYLVTSRIFDEQVRAIYRLIALRSMWQVISSTLNSKASLLIRGSDPSNSIVMI